MSELVEAWEAKISRDLAPFIDPGNELLMLRSGATIEVSWDQFRQTRNARFIVSRAGGGVDVEFEGRTYSYPAFFACERMADLTGIAKGTLSRLRSTLFVETKARIDGSDAPPKPATEVISERVKASDDADALTDLIMITAEAGAGKTSVLKELVRKQADAYVKGRAKHLYLYVDAQGRALARFNEALATELNDLRVMLPFHAVPTLVRLGLIVPVIDGFDELIGVGGYDDAYNSISSFIEDLEGAGVIIASARSTYYEQEFLSRANSTSALGSQSWRLDSVRILGWAEEERTAYIESLSVPDKGQVIQTLQQVFSNENEGLASKPLFVARAASVVVSGDHLSGHESLLEQLISLFLLREQRDKLRDKSERPILTVAELRSLCADFAEEMWAQGTRELDRATVKELAEIALSETALTEGSKQIVIERMPTMAFLMKGESPGSVAFEHELFFSYFLAERIAARIAESGVGLPLLLGRSVMPDPLAEGITAKLSLEGGKEPEDLIAALCHACSGYAPRIQLVKENAGKIVSQILRLEGGAVDTRFHSVVFPGSSLRDCQFESCRFESVEFKRADLAAASFEGCVGNQLIFDNPLISDSTRLDIGGEVDPSDFFGLRVAREGGEIEQVFDPTQIRDELAKVGFKPAIDAPVTQVRRVHPNVVQLVDKLARAYMRSNPVCVQEDGIFARAEWPEVERLAIRSGVVKEEGRATSGKPRRFLRRTVSPTELMAGLSTGDQVSEAVSQFWQSLEQAFPGG